MPSSPSTPERMTMATSSWKTSPSGVTTSSCRERSSTTVRPSAGRVSAGHLPGLLGDFLDAAYHEEGLLRQIVALAVHDVFETPHRIRQGDVFPGDTGELFGDVERLRKETLDLARPLHHDLVLVGELVHAQDGDDVLQLAVPLEDLLHAGGDVVVFVADGVAGQDARVGVERVDGRVDPLLDDGARQRRRRVQMGELQ